MSADVGRKFRHRVQNGIYIVVGESAISEEHYICSFLEETHDTDKSNGYQREARRTPTRSVNKCNVIFEDLPEPINYIKLEE